MTDITTIRKIITPIARSFGIKRVYLFGSYAKGNANASSDVDLLIEATCWGLSVSLDEAQLLLNGNNIKRQQLFQ